MVHKVIFILFFSESPPGGRTDDATQTEASYVREESTVSYDTSLPGLHAVRLNALYNFFMHFIIVLQV